MYLGNTVGNNGYEIFNLISKHFGSNYKIDNTYLRLDFFEQDADTVLLKLIIKLFQTLKNYNLSILLNLQQNSCKNLKNVYFGHN